MPEQVNTVLHFLWEKGLPGLMCLVTVVACVLFAQKGSGR